MRLFALIFCLLSNFTFAQDLTPDTLRHAASGFLFEEGTKLKLGQGTMPDGSFKYIKINSASLMSYYGNSPNAANSANALPPSFGGKNAEVARLELRGTRKTGYSPYAILKLGMPMRYECDIDNAIAAGELIIPGYDPKGAGAPKAAPMSLADELKKLKELLDAGAITKEEYDAMKKKLIGN
ncbi:MAG: SHOCT domain-containing protein [Chitinophagales bacterium]|nr:SHOCT domain-containing protein [Chitinophagales bacterium]